ncbi:MAG: endolytic transglycosylase MltG [Holosporales bacterium]|nr:endolytic transglycosylase MltG [Holosporales bacterium]
MRKFLLLILIIVSYLLFDLLKISHNADHSLFYVKNTSLYETVRKDGSFGSSIIFFIIDHIEAIKNKIQTGEYAIHYGDSAFSLLDSMLSRSVVIRKLTIPEGYTVQMIVELLNKNPLLCGDIKTIPNEASLFPSTYFYKFGDSRESLIIKMQTEMEKIIKKLQQKNLTNLTIEQIIILASIIEKETGVNSERKIISSVFHNRLSKNMRLQSDPTVIYALSNGYGKIENKLTRKDLRYQSPFNTYRSSGLPPTAICCPGKASLEAAIAPADTDFLYFVADKNQESHLFSKDYNEHKKNIENIKTKH